MQRRLLPLLALLALLATALAVPGSASAKSRYKVGLGEQSFFMFGDKGFNALKIKQVRVIVPWDWADKASDPGSIKAYLDAAKAIYTALLGTPHTDQPYYVGYNVDGFEVSLAPGEVAGGPVAYADVEDLDATRATLLAAGATERSAPRQVAPEARVCVLADADGNPIGLRGR